MVRVQQIASGKWALAMAGGKLALCVGCPKCDNAMELLADYRIDRHGLVRPDVVCPNLRCDFSEPVRLLGWKAGKKT